MRVKEYKKNITRLFIVFIILIIAAIYYLSELKPFAYVGYDNYTSELLRSNSDLITAVIETRFGVIKQYDPIVKSLNEIQREMAEFKNMLATTPNATIQQYLDSLDKSIQEQVELTTQFKRINPVLINAIRQFAIILSQIIEAEANVQLVESCFEQDYRTQLIDKVNQLFRGILIYISQRSEDRHQSLVDLVANIRKSPEKFPKLDLVLTYADKILELQPHMSEIEDKFLQLPIVDKTNVLNDAFDEAYQAYRSKAATFRVILYLLAFLLVVVLRWAFAQLQGTIQTLNIEVERKIKAEKALEETNRQLEQRVADRTHELTVKNKDLNQALSDLNEAQEQLIMQEKMASVGMLTTGIAHEIKNPLNFVNNFSDISIELVSELNQEFETHKEKLSEDTLGLIQDILTDLKTNCTKIKEHGERADNIVKNMLLHSQDSGVSKEMVDIKNLMEEDIKIAQESFNTTHGKFEIKLEKNFDPTLEKVLAAPQSIGRVFLYVVDNALYALKEKKLKAPPDYQPTLTVSIQKEGDNAVIKVRDNGTGIPKKSLDKVFEPFFTTKPTGKGNTGLGLSICYDTVVKQHKGELRVSSEEGNFTEFTIVLAINPKTQT